MLAAVDDGVSQRELARRYSCAPSLIARHVAKARRLREENALEAEVGADPGAGPLKGSMGEILEGRIRDPNTPGRELPGLVNALARLGNEVEQRGSDFPFLFRSGTLILEPTGRGPKSERRYRLMLRKRRRLEQIGDDLTAAQVFYLVTLTLHKDLGLPLEAFGLTSEDGVIVARPD